jgi:hypothetical protein
MIGRLKLTIPIPTSIAPAAIDSPAMTGSTIDATSVRTGSFWSPTMVVGASRVVDASRVEASPDAAITATMKPMMIKTLPRSSLPFIPYLPDGSVQDIFLSSDIPRAHCRRSNGVDSFAVSLQFVQITQALEGTTASIRADFDHPPGFGRGKPVARTRAKRKLMAQPALPTTHGVEFPTLGPTLADVESDPARFRCVALPLLLPGTVLTLNTRNTCYRLIVVNGTERRVTITGGKLFEENTEAELIGAVDDESVKVGWVIEGFQLELLTRRGPVLTSTVESVDVD